MCIVGFELLLSSSMYKELSMLYNFYTRFKEGQALICKAFGDFIKVIIMYLLGLVSLKHSVDQLFVSGDPCF